MDGDHRIAYLVAFHLGLNRMNFLLFTYTYIGPILWDLVTPFYGELMIFTLRQYFLKIIFYRPIRGAMTPFYAEIMCLTVEV